MPEDRRDGSEHSPGESAASLWPEGPYARPGSAPPDLLPFLRSEDGHYRTWIDIPKRPSSAPGLDQEHRGDEGASVGDEAELVGGWGSRQPVLDPKGKGLFVAYPIPAKLSSRFPLSPAPPRPSSGLGGGGTPGDVDRTRAANLLDLRTAALRDLEDHRRTPPQTLGPVPEAGLPARLAALAQSPSGAQSPSPPGLGAPGSPGSIHTPGIGSMHTPGGLDDGPQLLHPGAVRAFEPFDRDRPISAPPALDPGGASLLAAFQAGCGSALQTPDIRCDDSYPEFYSQYRDQNGNMPKPLDPSPDIARHRAGSIDASEYAAPEGEGHPTASTSGVGVTGFAAATGFAEPCPTPANPYHGGHPPRSPSPPWDVVAHHVAVATQRAAAAQGQLQQPPIMPVPSTAGAGTMLPGGLALPVPVPATGYSAAAAAAAAAAFRQPLLGAAGYPAGGFGEPWQALAAAGLAQTAARSEASSAGVLGMEASPPSKGSRAPGSGEAGGRRAGVPAAQTCAVSRSDGMAGRSAGSSGPDWFPEPGGSQSSAQAKKPSRGGFKPTHLEEMFASNAFVSNVYDIARDQAGCRMLQHKLDEGGQEIFSTIFSEVLIHAVELMMDPFGNYLCQKLMEMCSGQQLQHLLDKVCSSLVTISLNMHGARAVQKLIDVVRNTSHVRRLVVALEGAVVRLANDANGNHVVQRCLEALPQEAHFIFRAVAAEVVVVASDRHGCRIVQRCIEYARGHDRGLLVGAICRSSLPLVRDQFGNYVVQYVLNLQDPQANSEVLRSLLGRLSALSREKFSSNVIERCLQQCAHEEKLLMIRELADSRNLGELLRDVYGNYVVQSALSVTPEPELSRFLGAVRPLLPSLRASGQGRRIAQKLEKKYPQLRTGGTEAGSRGGGAAAQGRKAGAGAGAGAGARPSPPGAQAPGGGACGAAGSTSMACAPMGGACLIPGALTGVALATPAPGSGFMPPQLPPGAMQGLQAGTAPRGPCFAGMPSALPAHLQQPPFLPGGHAPLSQQSALGDEANSGGGGTGGGRGRQKRGGRRREGGGGQ